MSIPGVVSPKGNFTTVEEYVEFVGGQRTIKKVGVCVCVYVCVYT
jgi:hypothetical protein